MHLIPSLGPGGAERQLSIIARAQSESGVDCTVGYCSSGPNRDLIKGRGVHLHKFNVTGNYDPKLILKILYLVRSHRPDIIQTWLPQMDIVGALCGIICRTPYILSERSSAQNYISGWKTRLRILLAKHAAYIIANSQGGAQYWQESGVSTNIQIIRNGIHVSNTDDSDEQRLLQRIGNRRIIIFAGRFSHEKNVLVAMDAINNVLSNSDNVVALMLGEGELESTLKTKVSEKGLDDQVFFPGFTNALPYWMKKAAVLVAISRYEGNPNVVLEAALCGCPLVVSDIPAHREVLEEQSAVFVSGDVISVAAGISDVLTDSASAQARSVKAQSLVSNYSLDTVISEYSDVYNKILTKNSKV